MQNPRVSDLTLASRRAAAPAGSRWLLLVRDRVGHWLAGGVMTRANGSSAEHQLHVAWPDTVPVSHMGDPMGVDGAPAMVFTDSMPPYSTQLDRPQSTISGSAAFLATERADAGL